jgi:D-alanyl-lipoteichoic acid acyltransferase DltB (MBOAT superfamily)
MDVTSFQFLGFALAAGLLYNLWKPLGWRQAILLLANLAFLATMSSDWKGYIPLAAFLALGYAGVRLMQGRGRRFLFLPITVLVILIYVWLKRYAFIPSRYFLPFPYVAIGLSYIFFRVLHMVIDASDDALPESVGVISHVNYTLNFTTIAAGPIQFYRDFAASQLTPVRPPLTLAQCGAALERVVIGFFKLRILSAIFQAVQQTAVAHMNGGLGSANKLATACAIVVGYTFHLYFNFSGFIDLVIGLSRAFRMDLPENFDRPFSSTSFIEFWSRWHMSLSNWIKTYVYLPLVKLLMSKFPSRRVEPLWGVAGFFVAFFLVGVWHGQTSEFLCFGLLQGGGVSLNKLYQITLTRLMGRKRVKSLDSNAWYCAVTRGLTFTYFSFTLIWFWGNWPQIRHLASTLSIVQEIVLWIAIWCGSSVALAAWEVLRELVLSIRWGDAPALLAPPVRAAWVVYVAAVTLIALSIVTVSTSILYQIF